MILRTFGLSLALLLWVAPCGGQAEPATISSITLTRTGCMGSCPAYSLTLNDDGTATYIGDFSVPRVGTYLGYVDFDAFLDIVAPFDPWSLTDVNGRATDSPSLTITMVRGGPTKTVHLTSYAVMPTRFAGVVAAMDGVTAYTRWTPKSIATNFAGTYVDFSDSSTLDELLVRAGKDGAMYALRVRATSDSCQSLLLSAPVSLGVLTPVGRPPRQVQLADGSTMRLDGDAIAWTTREGTERVYQAVSSGLEFMVRTAFESYAMKAAHLTCP